MKPIVFFSHSSRDAAVLALLKAHFLEKTSGTIDVFLSSDGESIPFGTNWVVKIERALEDAKLMFAFVSPHSLQSSWLYFESGFVYSKGLAVVPVGINGLDIGTLRPPMSLLQGFNITSADGLNNLIARVNSLFAFKHALAFTAENYSKIFAGSSIAPTVTGLGSLTPLINDVQIGLPGQDLAFQEMPQIRAALATLFGPRGIEYQFNNNHFLTPGIAGEFVRAENYFGLTLSIDPLLATVSFPVASLIVERVRKQSEEPLTAVVNFRAGVRGPDTGHRKSALLFGSEIKIQADSGVPFKFRSLSFDAQNESFLDFSNGSIAAATSMRLVLRARLSNARLDVDLFRALLDTLAQRNFVN